MSAPTEAQRRLLKMLEAGLRLEEPTVGTRYPVRHAPNAPAFMTVQYRTVGPMIAAGWIMLAEDRYRLTTAGQALLDVGAHVRAFTAAAAVGA